ncbi:hypothetical protein PLEOSDRAFT_1014958, partial [Pleurotus ostreatus PC15]
MLWVRGALSPQEMRDQILNPDGDWQKKILTWLESCHIGEFLTGSMEEVSAVVAESKKTSGYTDPISSLPLPPPEPHICAKDLTCLKCEEDRSWWKGYQEVVDNILLQSNVHDCDHNKYGKCRARFPRPVVEETTVDKDTGSITLRKLEAWVNTFTPALSYIVRCNTDVTSMLSGTAVKAIVAYVSDYISKSSLKTHVMFECIQSVIQR